MLDRLCQLLYIGAGLVLWACPGRGVEPLVPEPVALATPVEVNALLAEWRPRRSVWHRFRWRYEDPDQRYSGRGSARIAPPDSLRFDFAGPLGMGSGAAVVVGREAVWARPERDFRSLVPAVSLLWAALGVVARPEDGAVAYWGEGDGEHGWRFVAGGDTVDYRLAAAAPSAARRLEVQWRRAGSVVGRGTTEFGPDGWPRGARVDFPEQRARFELTMIASDTNAVFQPGQWQPPPDR